MGTQSSKGPPITPSKGSTAIAIAKAAGRSVVDECKKLGKIGPNGVTVTAAGSLSCRHIIHVDMHRTADWNIVIAEVLRRAGSIKVESIAFPAIGTGGHKLSPTNMAKKMLDALEHFANHSDTTVELVGIVIFETSMLQTYRNYLLEKARANHGTESDVTPCSVLETGRELVRPKLPSKKTEKPPGVTPSSALEPGRELKRPKFTSKKTKKPPGVISSAVAPSGSGSRPQSAKKKQMKLFADRSAMKIIERMIAEKMREIPPNISLSNSVRRVILTHAMNFVRTKKTAKAGRRMRHSGRNCIRAGGRGNVIENAVETSCDTTVKPMHECSYMKTCLRYFGTLGISEGYVNSAFTMCYCEECHDLRKEDDYMIRGTPPKTYATPVGWCRIGLTTHVRANVIDAFKFWHRAYHGTSAKVLLSILKVGDLLLPGDCALGGKVIGEKLGHFRDNRKPIGFDTKQIFLSPSILYAGEDTYATSARYVDDETGTSYMSKVVLQVLVAPGSYNESKETIGALIQIDPAFKNEAMEWSTKERGSIIIYGLLIRLVANR